MIALPRTIILAFAVVLTGSGLPAIANQMLGDSLICPQIYQPVCGKKGSETRNFSNACLANGAGYAVIQSGSCDGASVLPRFCTKEYAPVCGERDGVRRVFGNACEARAESFAVVHDGRC